MTEAFNVVIVGAGHGGTAAAIALRQQGFSGSIAIVGDDAEFPYERPPLSKDYLSNEKPFERMLIRQPAFWEERGITLRLGLRVCAVDAVKRVLSTVSGEAVAYQVLIWAAGGRARRLSCNGNDLGGVHTIRTRADVDRLKDEMPGIKRVVIVGAGYIGLEAAAVLVKAGKRVVLLEALDRVLARVAAEPLSRFYEAEHRAHGVEIRLAAMVDCVLGSEGRVVAVRLVTGETIDADAVIVGVGILPEVEPLIAAGAHGEHGISVDGHCRTSLPHVYAIGDCVVQSSPFAGGRAVRIESVQNATDQAAMVAAAISGKVPPSYAAVPWFWSHQYDLKLQTVGLSTDHDCHVVRGSPEGRRFAVVYGRAGRIVALDCVNMTKDYVQGRKLVEAGALFDHARLRDALQPLGDYQLTAGVAE
jgi:3-phenylpropionate/trans-cinnamate dioxygenase ferredoxin reductase subunit